MPLKILADEDVDFRLINNLRAKGFEVISVLKDYQGVSDKEVLEIAKNREALLLTEDKDFGTWVFAHCEKCVGIIYLRYKAGEFETISNSLHTTLAKYGNSLYNKFTVITPRKLRIRELPD